MVKLLILVLFVFSSGCGVSAEARSVDKFMPDNDLWVEDNLNFVNNVDEDMFNAIIDEARKLYAPIAKEWEEELVINANWSDSTVNANASRDGKGWTEINMYGGLARRQEVLPIGFALVLCHELGHLYGGKPYISVRLKMAAEGQSDVYGAGWCLKNIVESGIDRTEFEYTPYMATLCNNDATCLRQLAGGQSLGNLLSVLSREIAPSYETPDKTVVTKTNTSYPKTTQCRLDSYRAGTLSQDRPLCWYKP